MKKTRKVKTKSKSKQSVGKKLLQKLQLGSKVAQLDQQVNAILESKRMEATFHTNMLFSINALVELLVDSKIITMEALEASRTKIMIEYQKERIAELELQKIANRYNNNPVHYDTTTDKWFVFAPNWKDKVGPFWTRKAAEEARRQIEQPIVAADSTEETTQQATVL